MTVLQKIGWNSLKTFLRQPITYERSWRAMISKRTRELVRTAGWNLFLKDKSLHFSFKKPYDILLQPEMRGNMQGWRDSNPQEPLCPRSVLQIFILSRAVRIRTVNKSFGDFCDSRFTTAPRKNLLRTSGSRTSTSDFIKSERWC